MDIPHTPEEQELIRLRSRLTKRFHKACADYSLIEDGDLILIGLSGGKDSLALIEFLGRRAQIYVPHFRVTAVHVRVRERAYQSDLSYLEEFCREWQVPFRVCDTEIKPLPEDAAPKEKDPCFLCSWYRRKALFETAKSLGCNKIALGHHRDDIVETLLMNLIFQGSFGTIMPMLQMDKMPLKLVRPLCLIDESDLVRYAALRGYEKQPKLCPFEKESSRATVKTLLHDLEKLNPNVRESMWNAITKLGVGN